MSKKSKTPVAAVIPSKNITNASMREEAGALGDAFVRVPFPLVDVIAEGAEMMLARKDVPELMRRGYLTSDAVFIRLQTLLGLLSPSAVRSEVDEDRADDTEAAEKSRELLLSIRERLARIGAVAGMDAKHFAVDLRRYPLLVDSMEKVIKRVITRAPELPDRETVDALVAQALEVITAEKDARAHGIIVAARRADNVRMVGQLKRLLYDQMREISQIGFAAFPDSNVRDVVYGLSRLTGHRAPESAPDPTDPPASPAEPEAPVA